MWRTGCNLVTPAYNPAAIVLMGMMPGARGVRNMANGVGVLAFGIPAGPCIAMDA
jgi:hypothetical protein